jgi:hypothetical protein
MLNFFTAETRRRKVKIMREMLSKVMNLCRNARRPAKKTGLYLLFNTVYIL